jgi:hypothetical protein
LLLLLLERNQQARNSSMIFPKKLFLAPPEG